MTDAPQSRKDSALSTLEAIRSAIEAENVEAAAEQVSRLKDVVADWQRQNRVRNARAWLDEALEADLLTFNTGMAEQHLERWQDAIQATDPNQSNPELDLYRTRVEERVNKKRSALHVRGVVSHCEELFAEAGELERGPNPPDPDFVLKNYYEKARNIAEAAQAENANSPELDVLARRAGRLRMDKLMAANVFRRAIQKDEYIEALNDLDQLPNEFTIPRYTIENPDSSPRKAVFENMVSISKARAEINGMTRRFAEQQVDVAMGEADTLLAAHTPQEAIDLLAKQDHLKPYLDLESRTRFDELQQRARLAQANKERAESLAQQAQQLSNEDPLAAWDTYAEATNLYEWATPLPAARNAVIQALVHQLETRIEQADRAFDERRMEDVRTITRNIQAQYANKSSELDPLIERAVELEDMTNQYDDYLRNANEIHKQVKELVWQDAVAANDLLSQLESFPDIVLEAFPELYQTRAQVNQRLNADNTYAQLYNRLFNTNPTEVMSAIEDANDALAEYDNDSRFASLERALKIHLAFIKAMEQVESGNGPAVLEALRSVATAEGHPDQEAAQQLVAQIRTQQNDGDSD